MILPDVNLLVHAHNLDSSVHLKARNWWDRCLGGTEGVGLAWATILGFIRVSTHPRIVANPLPINVVTERLASWLELPHFHIPHPSDRHFNRLRDNLEQLGTAGNLTSDAHLATLAIERGYILYSTDADFSRFPGLKWINPLTA